MHIKNNTPPKLTVINEQTQKSLLNMISQATNKKTSCFHHEILNENSNSNLSIQSLCPFHQFYTLMRCWSGLLKLLYHVLVKTYFRPKLNTELTVEMETTNTHPVSVHCKTQQEDIFIVNLYLLVLKVEHPCHVVV